MKNNDFKPETAHYSGHRQRTQRRFLNLTDTSDLADYELLELILMKAIPRIDVKPLAKELLYRFGNLQAVLTASEMELMAVKGVKQSTLVLFKTILECSRRLLKEPLKQSPVLDNWSVVTDYCCVSLQHEHREKCLVLYLDRAYRLIRQDIIQSGTSDRVAIYPKEILKQALNLGAYGVVVAHNHPSGVTDPSMADCAVTGKLYTILQVNDMALIDHLIVGTGRAFYSFAQSGQLGAKPRPPVKR